MSARTAVDVHPVTMPRIVTSEWIKLRSLRSTFVLLGVAVAGMLAVSLILASFTRSGWAQLGASDRRPDTLVDHTMYGFVVGQLLVAVLGVLASSSEYSTGMIRASLAAVPTRLPLLWAKAAVVALVALPVTLGATFAAFFASQAILGVHAVSLSHPGVVRALFGVGLYLTVVAVLGVALGFLTRDTAGGIAAVVGLLLVLRALGAALPQSVQSSIGPYLPPYAGQALLTLGPGEQPMLRPWAGFGVFVGYTLVALIAAAVGLRRRDA